MPSPASAAFAASTAKGLASEPGVPWATPQRAAVALAALLVALVGVYLWELGGQHIARNGDELVYMHIARLTAQSGQWLPLVSDLLSGGVPMRNTKPPLLFWQAMVAGGWGSHWSYTALRMPSLLYTLATALAVGYTAWLIAGQRGLGGAGDALAPAHSARPPSAGQATPTRWAAALLAAAVYLCFLSTYRYGRPYLTSAPETFWLNVPLFALLWHHLRHPLDAPRGDTARGRSWHAGALGGLALVGCGLAWGLGLAYKSFALLAPAGATLWGVWLLLAWPRASARGATCPANRQRVGLVVGLVVSVTWRLALAGAVALGLFALWFALDPDPGAVWREFVVAENAGKVSRQGGYLYKALWGGPTVWVQLLAYAENAGLLGLPVLGLAALGLRWAWAHRTAWARALDEQPRWLWALALWLAVWLAVFCLPSQRSARYVIPAMPALAVLLALYWPRVARAWFVAAALVCLAPLVFLARVVQALSALGVADAAELAVAWALLAGLALALLLALARPAWTRASLLAACLLVLASFQAALAPLNGPAGRFELGQQMARVSDQAGAQMGARVGARVGVQVGARGKSVAVFSPFNSSFERYEMLLPQALLKPYEDPRTTLPELLARHDWVLWASPAAQATPPPCAVAMPARCRVLAVRWDLKSRHNSGDIRWDNLLMPQQWLLQREWLLTADGLR